MCNKGEKETPAEDPGKDQTKKPTAVELATALVELGTTEEGLNAFLVTAGKQPLSASESSSSRSTQQPERDPTPKQSRIREQIAAVDVTKMKDSEIFALGAGTAKAMLSQVQQDKRAIICKDMDALAAAMAEDEDSTVEAAKERLLKNKARAFTAEKTGVIYFLKCPETPHDEIHETVHLVSAPGGKTVILSKFSELLNEGFTEFFTIKYCAELEVEVAPAYPEEVSFVTKLAKAVGLPMLHSAYIQNRGLDAIISSLADRWGKARAKWLAAFSTKDFPVPEGQPGREAELAARFKDNSYKEAPKWWNAILALKA